MLYFSYLNFRLKLTAKLWILFNLKLCFLENGLAKNLIYTFAMNTKSCFSNPICRKKQSRILVQYLWTYLLGILLLQKLSYAHECWNFNQNLHFILEYLANCFFRILNHFHFRSYSNFNFDFLMFYHHYLYNIFSLVRLYHNFSLKRAVFLFQDI